MRVYKRHFLYQKNKTKLFFLAFLIFWFLFFVTLNLKQSIFFNKKERINIVFYGKNTTVYSLGLGDEITYLIRYNPNLRFLVPGGYGYYRIGALGKLVFLEKKPEILKKAFSFNNGFFVDLYFYPKTDEIYFKNEETKKSWPTLKEIFFNQTNANIFDKLFIFYHLWLSKPSFYQMVDLSSDESFDREKFIKKFLGTFYKKVYRQEKVNVQFFYTKSYKTADLLSQILEGEGIRVVDITKKEFSLKKPCLIISSLKKQNNTVKDIKNFFGCSLKRGETPISDIIIMLGNLEDDWRIN